MNKLHNQPYDGPFGKLLFDEISRNEFKGYSCFSFMVAYARSSGVNRIAPYLERFLAAGGSVTAIVGIDQKNTTATALRTLLSIGATVYVFHDENYSMTFHPKIYFARKEGEMAWVAVGSNNLTGGGMYSNYEVSVNKRLDLASKEDSQEHDNISALLASYVFEDDPRCIKLDEKKIQDLLDAEYIYEEKEARQRYIEILRNEEKEKRPKLFGRNKSPEPPPGLEENKEKVEQAALKTAAKKDGFWKKLSPNDVSLTSSPGQIVIPIQFKDVFPVLSEPEVMENGAVQSATFFDVLFVKPDNTKEILKNVRAILYEPAPDHLRKNIEFRFTFRNHDILTTLKSGDCLVFNLTDNPDFHFSIQHLSEDAAKKFSKRWGFL